MRKRRKELPRNGCKKTKMLNFVPADAMGVLKRDKDMEVWIKARKVAEKAN